MKPTSVAITGNAAIANIPPTINGKLSTIIFLKFSIDSAFSGFFNQSVTLTTIDPAKILPKNVLIVSKNPVKGFLRAEPTLLG